MACCGVVVAVGQAAVASCVEGTRAAAGIRRVAAVAAVVVTCRSYEVEGISGNYVSMRE